MEKLKFYDLRKKASFMTDKYQLKDKMVRGHKRTFAVADAPSGIKSWRVYKAK